MKHFQSSHGEEGQFVCVSQEMSGFKWAHSGLIIIEVSVVSVADTPT